MVENKIAVLLTSHNRKDKTLACLKSFYKAKKPEGYTFDVFLVDDGSTDGTSDAIMQKFPDVNIVAGDGDLFWAGGMRLAWSTAMKNKKYHAFLLLNDDVVLYNNFIDNLLLTEQHVLSGSGKKGMYSGATIDNSTNKITYGGEKITTNHFIVKRQLLTPSETPQPCDLTNANILWISKEVVDVIGFFDERFTHGIADFDYSLSAIKHGFPVYLAPHVGGVCLFDHGRNWRSGNSSLKERISFLKSPKGLAYNEYLYYIKKHFPLYFPYAFTMLWLKTLFPFLWDKLKG